VGTSRFVPGSRHLVTSGFLAVRSSDGTKQFVTIPRGTIVEIAGMAPGDDMVLINSRGRLLMAFRRDIEERAQPAV